MKQWLIRAESTYIVTADTREEAIEIWENDPDGLNDSRINWDGTHMDEDVEEVA